MGEWKDDLTSILDVVSLRDPGLDTDLFDADEYASTRDPNLLRARPGGFLVKAKCKPLTYEVASQIRSLGDVRAQFSQAFRVGVVALENFGGPGGALSPTGEITLGDGKKHATWKSDELNRVATEYGRHFIDEIGMAILQRGEEGKAWGASAPYTPPRFLDAELTKMRLRRAELAKKRAGTGSSEQPSSGSPTASGRSSDAPGDAPAASSGTTPGA